jgi:hypothetical protein
VDEAEAKRRWVEEAVALLQEQGWRPNPEVGDWLERYYDEQPDDWKRRHHEQRALSADLERLEQLFREKFGPPPHF